MKKLFYIGLVCVVVGLLSFVINIPHAEQPNLQTGTIKVGVSRTEERHLPGSVGGVLIVAGLGMMVAGCRECKYVEVAEDEESSGIPRH